MKTKHFVIGALGILILSSNLKGKNHSIASRTDYSIEQAPTKNLKKELNISAGQITFMKTSADLKINNITFNFYPKGDLLSNPAKKGKQFIRLEVTITNPNPTPYNVNFTVFNLNTSTEKGVKITYYINEGNSTDCLKRTTLKQGESVTGALYYEVDKTETLETIKFSCDNYNAQAKKVQEEYSLTSTAEKKQ